MHTMKGPSIQSQALVLPLSTLLHLVNFHLKVPNFDEISKTQKRHSLIPIK